MLELKKRLWGLERLKKIEMTGKEKDWNDWKRLSETISCLFVHWPLDIGPTVAIKMKK